jgi:hypothetical protein
LTTAALLCLMAFGSALVLRSGIAQETEKEDEKKPKFTIKQVMEKAHKNKLLNKVAEGKATEAEAKELVELYRALGKNEPPRGETEAWKKKTVAILEAAEDTVAKKEGAAERLTKAANCANCHKEHKPPAQ